MLARCLARHGGSGHVLCSLRSPGPFVGAFAAAQQTCGFLTKKSGKRRRNERPRSIYEPPVPAEPVHSALKKFFLKVHPDLFTHYPREKQLNQEALSRFQAFMDEIKDRNNPYPSSAEHEYTFYLKTDQEGQFKEATLRFKTSGGDCNKVVKRSLEVLFKECGLPEKLAWGPGDWLFDKRAYLAKERAEAASQR